MQYIIVSFIVLGIFVVTTMMLCGMANSTDHEKDDAEQLKGCAGNTVCEIKQQIKQIQQLQPA